MNGFSLMELMLSLSLGLSLSGVMFQGLMAEGQNGARFSRFVRERAVQQRTLQLVKADLAQATAVSSTPALELHACSLAGRLPVLHLTTAAGSITYSVGAAPSTIWRGRVLMRCGPPYGLAGQLRYAAVAQNRVVMDGLAQQPRFWNGCARLLATAANSSTPIAESLEAPFSACVAPDLRLVALRLEQLLGVSPTSAGQRLVSQQVMEVGG